ncbi:MAG: class I SAM-dependent methyltransferase [Pseudomonadota bacterium]
MGREVNLVRALPKTKRNIQARQDAKDPEVVRISKQFGQMYFDGPRDYGYGGYKYDGRWVPVAHDIIDHFGLKPGMRVLDAGCAKGFLVKDLRDALPGLEVTGLEISEYAIENAHPDAKPYLIQGTIEAMPFTEPFDAVLCLDTVHNLPRERAKNALKEIQRLSAGCAYVRVDSYLTPKQEAIFESWVLTAEFHGYPDEWLALFEEAGYTGDYSWTIIS